MWSRSKIDDATAQAAAEAAYAVKAKHRQGGGSGKRLHQRLRQPAQEARAKAPTESAAGNGATCWR